jgi:hypothetical protein
MENVRFNRAVLEQVTGACGALQVIDSASFNELPMDTLFDLCALCETRNIKTIILEQHWMFRGNNPRIKAMFARIGVACKFILGLESFDEAFRENFLNKCVGSVEPAEMARHYDWVNLLCAVRGQTFAMIAEDIETALAHFERVTVNMFIPNASSVLRDDALGWLFYESLLFQRIRKDPRVEILDILDDRAPDRLGGVGYPKGEET